MTNKETKEEKENRLNFSMGKLFLKFREFVYLMINEQIAEIPIDKVSHLSSNMIRNIIDDRLLELEIRSYPDLNEVIDNRIKLRMSAIPKEVLYINDINIYEAEKAELIDIIKKILEVTRG